MDAPSRRWRSSRANASWSRCCCAIRRTTRRAAMWPRCSSRAAAAKELSAEQAATLSHDAAVSRRCARRRRTGRRLCRGRGAHHCARAARRALDRRPGGRRAHRLERVLHGDGPFPRSRDEEVLTFTDCAVVRYPRLQQLADIAIAAAVDRRTHRRRRTARRPTLLSARAGAARANRSIGSVEAVAELRASERRSRSGRRTARRRRAR